MKCPVCTTELANKYFQEIRLLHCPSCGGLWVRKKKLGEVLKRYMSFLAERHDKAIGRRKRVNPWKVETVKIICPECGRSMTKLNYAYSSNVIVDTCETCGGTWLDKGEVEKIAAYLKYCGLPENFKKEIDQIRTIYDKAERQAATESLVSFLMGVVFTALAGR